MGLKTAIAKAVEAGFNAMGSSDRDGIQTSMEYVRLTKGDYNPMTGKAEDKEERYTFDVVFYKVRDREVDGEKVKINDIRVVFPRARLPLVPNSDDHIFLRGKRMEIVNEILDPAEATYILFVRGV